MNEDAALTAVDTSVPVTPVPAAVETPATPPPVTDKPAPDKPFNMRDSLQSSLRAVRDRSRDDAGRFAVAPQAKPPDAPAVVPQATPTTPAPAAVVNTGRPTDMPKAWGADKATAWAGLPPEAKAYIATRETQMEQFHANFAGLKPWQEAAAQNQTTLPEVLERVSRVENAMIADPSDGLVQACQMVGLDQQAAVQALSGALRRLGVQVGPGQQPGVPQQQGQQPAAQQPQTPASDPRLDAVMNEINGIKSSFQKQEEAKANTAVQAFAADPANKFYTQVSDDIVRELKAMRATGQTPDLKLAYERACWGRTDIREQLVAEQVAAKVPAATAVKSQELERSRSASRSVTGSPPAAEGRSSADTPTKTREIIAQGVRNAMSTRV